MTCPLCGGATAPRLETTDRNRALSDETFRYRECQVCGVVFLENVPADLGRFYPDAYYGLPTLDGLEQGRGAEQHKLDLLGIEPGGRLIEVGPGAGGFAWAAKRAGFDVAAVEMDERACEHLRAVVGVEATQTAAPHEALRELPPSRAIAFWHVLEHLPDPWAALEAAAANLEPGGVLAVAVPNPDSLQLRVLGARWAHIDAPRHLFLFPSRLLRAKAAEDGLRTVRVTARDRGGLHWNRFGWQQLVTGAHPSRPRALAGIGFGVAASLLMSPIELRDLSGATYTAVFRKDA